MNLILLNKFFAPVKQIYKIHLLLFFLCCLGNLNVRAQEAIPSKISVELKNLTLKQIFIQLENTTGYHFQYTDDISRDSRKFSFKFSNENIEEVVARISETAQLEYKINGIDISIRPVSKKRIKGTVLDASSNMPLPGVTILIDGTLNGTSTDYDGNFSIEVAEGVLLRTSYLGYKSATHKVGKANQINFILEEEITSLDEVVVVGYGTVNKKDVTGSVSVVDVEELKKAPVNSFDQALAGRIAGVQVSSQEDGQPGSTMNIVIRGAGSLTQSTQPLYVVDGVPFEDFDNSTLNPEEIESITILKDASETAIYGARGANGVVVIETKQGKSGKPVIEFETSGGIEEVYKTIDMMSAYEFVKYELERNPSLSSVYLSENRDLDYYKGVEGIDWQDQLFSTGNFNDYSLAVRGGSEDTKYSLSGSYLNNEAIVVNTGFQRYQARLKLDQNISERTKIGANVNYTVQKAYGQIVGRTASSTNTSINGYLLYSVWGYRPVAGINGDNFDFDLENELVDEEAYEDSGIFTVNPVINAENVLRENTIKVLYSSAYLHSALTNHLDLNIRAGYTNRMGRNDQFYNSKTHRGTSLRQNNTDGINGSVSHTERINWVNENTLTYKKFFGRKHYLKALGGFTVSGRDISTYGFRATNLPNEALGVNGLSQGELRTSTSTASKNTMASFYGRFNYRLLSKYYLTFTMRADGSSKFPTQNKWGYFPSAALAWKLGEEKVFKNLKFVSDAKLRASYGLTGNNRVSDYAYMSTLGFSDLNAYSFNNDPVLGMDIDLGNENLKWETVKQLDLGLDLSLFNDRINLVTDVYRKVTDDMLLNTNIPGSSGFTRVYTNVGSIENKGLEITLNTLNINTSNFSWHSNFNISFNQNKIESLSNGETSRFSYISSFSRRMAEEPMYVAQVGGPAAMFYGLVWDGNYQYEDFDLIGGTYVLKSNIPTNGDDRSTIQPGDIKYKDLNMDGIVDANDKTIIGSPIPKHIGGFSNTFNYKGLSLNVLFQWSYGNDILNANRIIFEGNPTRVNRLNQYASYANRWTPENPNNEYYRVNGEGPEVLSSRTIEDGSYLRLKTLSLGYTIPKDLLENTGISKVNLALSAQNLITWTNYSGLDPEVSTHNSVLTPGFDFSAYPHSRRIVFSLNLTL